MKKLFTFFLTLFAASSVWAGSSGEPDFEVDGIYYIITSDNTVEVTYDRNKFERRKYTNDSNEWYVNLSYSGTVVIPSTVTYEGKQYTVTSIGHDAFRDNDDLTSLTIPNTVTSIDDCALICFTITSLYLPDNFQWTITDVYGDEITREMGGIGFRKGDLVYYIKNDGTAYVGRAWKFDMDKLTEVEIPETITISSGQTYTVVGVEGDGFSGCEALTSVTFPKTLQWIEWEAFEGDRNLSKVTCYATTPPEAYGNSFDNYGAELYIPCESKELYEYSAGWASFRHIMCGTTAVSEVSANEEITVIDNQIFVNGEAPAFVVTVSGQKIANANLKAGVYFVVAEGKTVKFVVR